MIKATLVEDSGEEAGVSALESNLKTGLMTLLLVPTLLTPPLVYQFVLCRLPIGLVDAATCLFLWYTLIKNRSSPMLRAFVYFVTWAAVICSIIIVGVGCTLSPVMVFLFGGCLVGAGWVLNRLARNERLVLSLLIAASVSVKLVTSTMALMVDTDDPLHGTSELGVKPAYAAEQVSSPARRYRIIYDDNTNALIGLPYEAKSEFYNGGFSNQPQIRSDSFIREASVDDKFVAVAHLEKGMFILSRLDLKSIPVENEVSDSVYRFLGVVYRRSTNEIIGLRTDGRLLFFDYSTRELKRKQWLPDVQVGDSVWDERYNDMHLFQDRYLVVTEQGPPNLVLIDLQSSKLIKRAPSYGPAGNLSSVDNGKTFFVIGFPFGGLQHRDVATLDVIRKHPLGFGFRYHAIFPDKRHVAAGNYITGEVWVIDVETGKKTGPFHTGLRLQWLSVSPDGKFLDASHFQGVTRMKMDELLMEPAYSRPAALFPFWILRPGVVVGVLARSLEDFGLVAVNWALFLFAIVLFRRTMVLQSAVGEVGSGEKVRLWVRGLWS